MFASPIVECVINPSIGVIALDLAYSLYATRSPRSYFLLALFAGALPYFELFLKPAEKAFVALPPESLQGAEAGAYRATISSGHALLAAISLAGIALMATAPSAQAKAG